MSTAVQITLGEFIARPEREDDQREELIEGVVVLSPGPQHWHAWTVEQLREQLAPLKKKGYVLMNDFSCILGDRSMPVPDLAAIRKDRSDQAMRNGGWLEGSPELVIEVSSPSNRKLQRKANLYLEHGAEQVWIVYPKKKTITVVTPEGGIEARMGDRIEFHSVQVQVDSIFLSN